MVSCNKIPFLNKQPPQPEQPTFIARKSGTPVNPFALNRLAKETVVEIVSEGYLTGGNKYLPKGSGVIIGRKDSVYYVLTADHISDIDDGLSVFIRSEKPGKLGEVLPLKFIRRYPREDLAVVTFLSFTNYKVAEVGEASQLDDDNQVYVAGWPGAENRQGFQFTPAKVTNPQVGDNLTYQPTEPSESLYKGMSGGAVLNEAGQLVGIHVGLTKVGGDGKGVLISTFLQMVPPEVEEVLGSSTPDVLSSSSSDNEEVKLRRQLEEERRKREEAEGLVEKLEAKLFKETEGRKQEGEKKIKNDKKRFCLWGYVWWSWFLKLGVWGLYVAVVVVAFRWVVGVFEGILVSREQRWPWRGRLWWLIEFACWGVGGIWGMVGGIGMIFVWDWADGLGACN
ncbi:S1 family peptidase [Trichodesmium erythraeum]|uniref:S1 family peptidase n=1 Tax=Trichodesmium erythraeum TaxID=1206 RepID=UPI00003C9F56|nr:trypsin-like peptidase domain-containing protein [Trichodesmium erythraeum GBRTRLIN201]